MDHRQRLDTSERLSQCRQRVFVESMETWANQARINRGFPVPVSRRARRRWLASSLALAVLICSAVGYVGARGSTPVIASQGTSQGTFTRAATMGQLGQLPLMTRGVAHAIYAMTVAGKTRTVDEWLERDARGVIAHRASMVFNATGALDSRTIVQGSVITTYVASSNSIIKGVVATSPVPDLLDSSALSRLIQQAQRDGRLRTQKLQGALVDAVEIRSNTSGVRRIATVFIDARALIARGLDVKTIDAAGHELSSSTMRLTSYSVGGPLSPHAMTFALNAPSNAHILTAPDGSTQLGTEPMTLDQALALTDRPALVLSDGAQLFDISYTRTPDATIINYQYTYNSPDQSVIGVSILVGNGALFKAPPVNNPTTVTVAGQRVQAHFFTPAPQSHYLLYTQGGVSVRAVAGGIDETAFLWAVNSLVDGHTHAPLIIHSQKELAAHAAISQSR